MSVVGVDFGSVKTVIAVARNRGVDVIANEVSNRSTPSLVAFGAKNRFLGEAAKTQEMSNLKNTVSSLKRLVGRTAKDPDIEIEQQFLTVPIVDVNGQAGIEVSYHGEKTKFSATQLVAMYLTKIRQTAVNELRAPVSDMVMSVPAWFTDAQRRCLIDAADIAGLKLLRLMNDTTAAALGYGITKTDLPTAEEKPRRVAFVDIGHSTYTVSIIEFRKGELSVKSTAFDRHFGGRDFDKALVDHLGAEFKAKYKSVDISQNARAYARVVAAAEKAKKVLSANSQAHVTVESVMNDIDASKTVTRQEFEEMVTPLLDRVHFPLEEALKDAHLTKDDIDAVELIGGGTRVPSLKERIGAFFGKTLSFTTNQDEAVARGCAFSCAILSPAFRVRDFAVQDIISYPIEFAWEKAPDIPDEDTSLTVFQKGNVIPSTKILTFYRKQPFDLEARYADPQGLPGKTSPWIGRFAVKGVKADDKDDFMVCKLKARINIHGVLNVESGYYVEDQEVEEEIKEDAGDKDPNTMETDKTEEAPKKTRLVKKQIRKGDLPIVSGTNSLDTDSKNQLHEKEVQMIADDKLVADTEEKKNELETSIYDLRDKLDSTYREFTSQDEKDKLLAKLSEVEEWLYEDGYDATKGVYIAKMDEIRSGAGPIMQRHFEKMEAERKAEEERAAAVAAAKRAEDEARKAAEEEARKAAEQEKAANAKDEEMTDADAPKDGDEDKATK